jgi:formylglycine-generating enzyme required for sulfatase activity
MPAKPNTPDIVLKGEPLPADKAGADLEVPNSAAPGNSPRPAPDHYEPEIVIPSSRVRPGQGRPTPPPPPIDKWRPAPENVQKWAFDSANEVSHYAVLELAENADNASILARVTTLQQQLGEWSQLVEDPNLRAIGPKGLDRLAELRKALADRPAYDASLQLKRRDQLRDRFRNEVSKGLVNSILPWHRYKVICEDAQREEFPEAELKAIFAEFQARGITIQTTAPIGSEFQFGTFDGQKKIARTPVELAQLLEQYPERGKEHLYASQNISTWTGFDQSLSLDISKVVKKEYPSDELAGLWKCLYLLDPAKPYRIGPDLVGQTLGEIGDGIEQNAGRYQPLLTREPNADLYLYLEARGWGDKAATFRNWVKQITPKFTATRVFWLIILDLQGNAALKLAGRTFASPAELVGCEPPWCDDFVTMLQQPDSKLAIWLERFSDIQPNIATWRDRKRYNRHTLSYALEPGSPFHFYGDLAHSLADFKRLFAQHIADPKHCHEMTEPGSWFVVEADFWLRNYQQVTLSHMAGGKFQASGSKTPLQPLPAAKIISPAIPAGLILVVGGSFMMGSNEGGSDEKPVHRVTLSNFLLGKYQLTFAEYDQFCQDSAQAKPSDNGWGRGTRPVINVSWLEAIKFCNWKSQQEGLAIAYKEASGELLDRSGKVTQDIGQVVGYRLATEAEWEYAARGGNKSKGYAYSGSDTLAEVAWYSDNAGGKTQPVGEKKANELGLFDMSGNIWEWCQDWYDGSYYGQSAERNPFGPAAGSDRVSRGGSWSLDAARCRSGSRGNNSPGSRRGGLGFRLARSSP